VKHLFFCAGELSGDLHAAKVVARLQGRFRVSGIGGDAMAGAGQETLHHIRETAVMGFLEVARNYPRLRRILKNACSFLSQQKPDLLVCVDYPGFNLKLAAHARDLGIPVLYYIAPKVWAWGKGRIGKMRKVVDRCAVIFPFEEEFFKQRGIDAQFVGNPLLEQSAASGQKPDFRQALGIAPRARVLGILPGSREQEVRRMLPAMAQAGSQLCARGAFDMCVVSRAPGVSRELVASCARAAGGLSVWEGGTGSLQREADFLIVKSGTATLETALERKPFIVVYRTSAFSAFIARSVLRIPDISLLNIICGKRVVPELLQEEVTAHAMVQETLAIWENEARKRDILEQENRARELLGTKKPSYEVEHMIEEMVNG